MERVAYVLFELNGRIKRVTWLTYFGALLIAETSAEFLFRWLFDFPAADSSSPAAYFDDSAGLLAGLIFLWPSVAVDVKRWHDIGQSGWLTLIAYGPLFALYVLELGFAGTAAISEKAVTALTSLMGLVFLVYLILLAARKGTPAANRFGPA
ncbi:MAG: DUF805 domain-containing protein [Rhodomicrobium sp.]